MGDEASDYNLYYVCKVNLNKVFAWKGIILATENGYMAWHIAKQVFVELINGL